MQVTSLTLPTPQAFRFAFLSQMKAGWEQVAFLPLLTPCAQSCFFFLLLSLGTRRAINRLYNSRHLDQIISS